MKACPMTVPLLEAISVTKTYTRQDAPPVEALRGLDLRVEPGEFLALTGPSGCGKSTLLTVLSGLDLPTSGQVLLKGQDLTATSEDSLAQLRNREIGFVFQAFHLVPSMTALENVAFPAELAGDRDALSRSHALLARVGLSGREQSFPHQLSGGEKQRVAICRAVVNRASLIFADEPTGNLDSANGHAIMQLLLQMRAEHGCSLVLVSHSPEVVALADRVVNLADGRVAE
jgi:putative ABC transport system ATP-binding protein